MAGSSGAAALSRSGGQARRPHGTRRPSLRARTARRVCLSLLPTMLCSDWSRSSRCSGAVCAALSRPPLIYLAGGTAGRLARWKGAPACMGPRTTTGSGLRRASQVAASPQTSGQDRPEPLTSSRAPPPGYRRLGKRLQSGPAGLSDLIAPETTGGDERGGQEAAASACAPVDRALDRAADGLAL
jgi:hypothetical protein